MGTRLFVIDGSPAVRRMVEQVSSKEGYEVHAFPDGPSALRAAKNLTPQTVIADFHLDKITFSSFCKELGKLDNMGESSIISLVDSSDKVDESTYRSLGVAVFLTKPLEPGNLIEALRDLSSKHIKKTSPAKGKRTWPPVTTSTDLDDDAPSELDGHDDSTAEAVIPDPAPETARMPSSAPVVPAPATQSQPAPIHLEAASKSLIDAMAAGVVPQVTQIILTSLPGLVGKELEQQMTARLENAVRQQVSLLLSPVALSETVEPLIRREASDLVAKQLTAQLATLEASILGRLEEQLKPLVQQATEERLQTHATGLVEQALPGVVREQLQDMDRIVVSAVQDLAAPHVRETVPHVVREAADAQLPKLVQEHVGSIDRLVVNTVQDLASSQVREKLDQLVLSVAQERVAEAVKEIVPAVAETQVTKEIQRLSVLD
ncbi:hypothetical protein YTPLAS18_16590 [Nitrospira sp.]|nr:hypothetical protein YTPLAS18_16590 [Nitrospira sp.]